MNLFTVKQLKGQARSILLETTPPYRNLVLLHSLVYAAAQLALFLLGMLTESMMAGTGGLSGMGTRAILGTVESVLSFAADILLPFWQLGILYTTLLVLGRQQVNFSMLTRGVRRFGPLLRFMIVYGLIATGVSLAVMNVMSFVVLVLPVPEEMMLVMEKLEPDMLMDPVALMESLPMEELMQWLLPAYILMFAALLIVMVYLGQRLRFGYYLILDDQTNRALEAVSMSFRMTKGAVWQCLKLDLSFLWYTLLGLLPTAFVFSKWLFPAVGIELPIAPEMLQLVGLCISYALELLLVWWAGAHIEVTKACAYQWLLPRVLQNPNP